MEVTVASGALLVILLLAVHLMGSLASFWTREQARLDRFASARLAMETICRHLGMAGCRTGPGGLHVMEESAVTVEYLAGGTWGRGEDECRERLYEVSQRGDRVMLTIRSRVPENDGFRWSTGSSTELASGVESLRFSFLDGSGANTAVPREVRVVICSLRFRKAAGDRRVAAFRTAVALPNNRSIPG